MAEWIPLVDISKWQGDVDVQKLVDAGIKHVYLRGLYGIIEDSKVRQTCRLLRKAGIRFGLYLWYRPNVDAKTQARMLVEMHRLYGATMIPQIDVEDAGGLPPRKVRRGLTTIVNFVTAELGKPPTIYSAGWFWDVHVKSDKFGHCPLWLAKYVKYSKPAYKLYPVPLDPAKWDEYALQFPQPKPLKGWDKYLVWQFSAGFNGCGARYGMESSDLDLNIMRAGALSRFLLP